jgi:hypothetical protein
MEGRGVGEEVLDDVGLLARRDVHVLDLLDGFLPVVAKPISRAAFFISASHQANSLVPRSIICSGV